MRDDRPPHDDFPIVLVLVSAALMLGAWVVGPYLLWLLFGLFL